MHAGLYSASTATIGGITTVATLRVSALGIVSTSVRSQDVIGTF
jgi:hypothetical protein